MQDLSGKTAVVTGAASGIGLAMTERFAAEGMQVVMADVEGPALEVAAAKLRDQSADVLPVLTDVTKTESVDALAAAAFDRYGAVHVVCNNAGVVTGGSSWELSSEAWDWIIAVNLKGVVNGVRAFVPRLIKQGEGHVVNTASILGLLPTPMVAPYVATKFAVVGLSETLFHELAMIGSRVGVSVVCPSWVNTGIIDAERNWPTQLGPRPEDPAGSVPMRETLRTVFEHGLSPAAVASNVLDAILNERFWVFPHPELAAVAAERMIAAAEGKNPAFATALLDTAPIPIGD